MKLAIYETVHLDWVLPYCELFLLRNEEVYFLTNISFEKDIKETLGDRFHRFKWTFLDTEIGPFAFYKELKRFFSAQIYKGIILNSIEARHLIVAAAIRNSPMTFINVHDINNYFKPAFALQLRQNIRSIGKKWLHQKADGYIINAEAMKDFITKNKLSKKPVYWLPPVIERASLMQLDEKSLFTFTIPGSIDEKRRDYQTVLEAFAQLHELYTNQFLISLAGRPVGAYGQMILKKVKALQEKGIQISYSETEIEEIAFQKLIASSSIIISPLTRQTVIHDNIKEEYGTSKVSGNIYDAIRHGKPMIVPDYLTLPKEISSSCLKYKNKEDLLKLLIRCINEKDYINALLQQAFYNSKQFSVTSTMNKLETLLNVIATHR